MTDLSKDLKALGSQGTTYHYNEPHVGILETFPSPLKQNPSMRGEVLITAPEFTSLCPKTGQPDFATIIVRYTPNELCVESKSFKLYLGAFRMVGEFHESCVARIAQDLISLLDPITLTVEGQFTPRGGIPFWPKVVYQRIAQPNAQSLPK